MEIKLRSSTGYQADDKYSNITPEQYGAVTAICVGKMTATERKLIDALKKIAKRAKTQDEAFDGDSLRAIARAALTSAGVA